MKISSFKGAILSVVAMGLVLASCNTSIEVAKRKHRKGYHVAFNKKQNKTSVQKSVAETIEFANVDSPAVDTAKVKSAVEAPKTSIVTEKSANETTVKTLNNESQISHKKEKMTFAKKVKAVKQLKKKIKALKSQESTAGALDDDEEIYQILLIILAIILPPVAVFLLKQLGVEFWISLILTLLFWLPGIIYALLLIFGVI